MDKCSHIKESGAEVIIELTHQSYYYINVNYNSNVLS